MLNLSSILPHSQLPLIHVVNEDDKLLSNNCDSQWYSILQNFPWENYRELGASYYNALYDFNIILTNDIGTETYRVCVKLNNLIKS
jgi:hypothetical protein